MKKQNSDNIQFYDSRKLEFELNEISESRKAYMQIRLDDTVNLVREVEKFCL